MPAEPAPRAEGPVALLALSAFGLGLSPLMPGTVGSLATVLAVWLFASSPVSGMALLVLLFLYGTAATLRFGGHVKGPDGHGDPGWVVSDEVAGQVLPCVPVVLLGGGWMGLLAAFLLFRLFDIWKPGPVGRAERVPGATGILLDDVVAGLLAAVGTTALALSGWGV